MDSDSELSCATTVTPGNVGDAAAAEALLAEELAEAGDPSTDEQSPIAAGDPPTEDGSSIVGDEPLLSVDGTPLTAPAPCWTRWSAPARG